MTRSDVFVLGAGMIGISVAAHLQKRGRAVTLIDRRGAAEETSFGNAGLIQREGIFPYGFPHDFGALLRPLGFFAALKATMAHVSRDPAWRTARPPVARLAAADQATLEAGLARLGIGARLAAE